MVRNEKKMLIGMFMAIYPTIRFVLQKKSGLYAPGIIVVMQDSIQCKLLFEQIQKFGLGEKIEKLSMPTSEFNNFKYGCHLLKNRDKHTEIRDFLEEEEYIPLLLVPTFLPIMEGCEEYVISLHTAFNSEELTEMKKTQEWIFENIDCVLHVIERWKMQEYIDGDENVDTDLFSSMIVVAEVKRAMMKSLGFTDAETEQWMKSYLEQTKRWIQQREFFLNGFWGTELVRNLLWEKIRTNKRIRFAHVEAEGDFDTSVIFYDDERYYIKESLLREICRSVLSVVSLTYIKSQLKEEQALLKDNVESNFTRKTQISYENGVKRRERFLQLYKAPFCGDDGRYIEEINWQEK